jgi:Domain of unknown function (DUF4279)
MKPVPSHILSIGPQGTTWFGGAVDRSRMNLRVMAKIRGESVDKAEVSRLLGCESDQEKLRHWSLHAPERNDANLDEQISWIFERVTRDLSIWKRLTSDYRVDLFCALYLEQSNRGISLLPTTMSQVGARGIELGFDIYAP